jgi:ABC-type microcin C transport system duplicated ATPase subunit YejF
VALLSVRDLSVSFHTRNGVAQAVDRVSFELEPGETLAIVGESGSGKSVSCYSLLGLVPQPPGRIDSGVAEFDGTDLLSCSPRQIRGLRGNDIGMIFQDPMTCLNPYLTVGEQLIEPLVYHRDVGRRAARERALEVLADVGIDDAQQRFRSYPHQLSGGQRQRVMIAMALINEPRLIIADEPTTALDVTIQAQILRLLKQLQQRYQLAVVFVTHDLAVVADIADQVVVMCRGEVVEQGSCEAVLRRPQHDYTRQLLAAIPSGAKPVAGGAEPNPLVEVRGLKTWFGDGAQPVKAVDDVSLEIRRGEILGLVGESGSGKSTLGRSILQLVRPTAGSVRFDGEDLPGKTARQLLPLRRRMQMIFQDPFASLNPRMTVFDTLAEPLLCHGLATRGEVAGLVLALMDEVGLARSFVRKYPHEFSGGQRQRIAIGRAIATRPEFIVADEPVSALDVTIQAQVLDLILRLVADHHLTMLFISHDMAVVRYICDRTAVMYRGRLVEVGDTEQLFHAPGQEYTRSLLAAVPGGGL